ncbi:hypothetical protein ONS96_003961 [Cadophora gregata f. sp. sojae]|nr:hypothetical protein ONS96_003961 [Cadophora gregata f. sp. sojae]
MSGKGSRSNSKELDSDPVDSVRKAAAAIEEAAEWNAKCQGTIKEGNRMLSEMRATMNTSPRAPDPDAFVDYVSGILRTETFDPLEWKEAMTSLARDYFQVLCNQLRDPGSKYNADPVCAATLKEIARLTLGLFFSIEPSDTDDLRTILELNIRKFDAQLIAINESREERVQLVSDLGILAHAFSPEEELDTILRNVAVAQKAYEIEYKKTCDIESETFKEWRKNIRDILDKAKGEKLEDQIKSGLGGGAYQGCLPEEGEKEN